MKMKTSQKILWGGMAACFFAIILTGVLIRWQAPPSVKMEYNATIDDPNIILGNKSLNISAETKETKSSRGEASSIISLSDFNQLMIKNGEWQVNIKQGPAYAIKITQRKGQEGDILVTQQGKVLILSSRDSHRVFSNVLVKADITMPTLNAISAAGEVRMMFENFHLDTLDLNLAGETSILGEHNRIENLIVNAAGQSEIDFLSSEVHQANLHTGGETSIRLHLVDGELTGYLAGNAKVRYTGTLRSNTLHALGMIDVSALDLQQR